LRGIANICIFYKWIYHKKIWRLLKLSQEMKNIELWENVLLPWYSNKTYNALTYCVELYYVYFFSNITLRSIFHYSPIQSNTNRFGYGTPGIDKVYINCVHVKNHFSLVRLNFWWIVFHPTLKTSLGYRPEMDVSIKYDFCNFYMQ
jgi:hypothetical protein